jgi:hypothetical protein
MKASQSTPDNGTARVREENLYDLVCKAYADFLDRKQVKKCSATIIEWNDFLCEVEKGNIKV